MAMTYTVDDQGVWGDLRYAVGTFTMAGGDTAGVVTTGLGQVYFGLASNTTRAAGSPKVEKNTTLPGQIKITVGTAGDDGFWFALGR